MADEHDHAAAPMPRIARLSDLPPRDAWPNEAHDFTPWLAENLDQLGEAVGIPLELTRREMAVEEFSADILARTPAEGENVLIENQLGRTDHSHLGQIMTYLAGLDARIVIWIAPEFREPHLSAIRWLNQHTAEGFSFFAVRLRVVRIGESPAAPIFEVLEKPNGWERRLQRYAVETAGSAIGDLRAEFWRAYLERYPMAADWGLQPRRHSTAWVKNVLGGRLWLSLWIGNESCGLFIRGPFGSDPAEVEALLAPVADRLGAHLGVVAMSGGRYSFAHKLPVGAGDREKWPDIMDWMEEKRCQYVDSLHDVIGPV